MKVGTAFFFHVRSVTVVETGMRCFHIHIAKITKHDPPLNHNAMATQSYSHLHITTKKKHSPQPPYMQRLLRPLHYPSPILPSPPPIILNRDPRPLLAKAAPRILISTAAPAPLTTPRPVPIIMIALARRRLHISVMLILRPGTMLPLAPILALTVYILAASRTRRARTHARARRDLDVVRAAVVAGRMAVVAWWRRGSGHRLRGRLDEDRHGLRCGNGEGFGCRHCDVGL